MFSIRTERTNIARRIVNEAMTFHFVLALESFTTFATLTAFDGTVVRSV